MQNFQDKESRVPLVEEDLVKQRREELRHAQDIREHYERKLERANNLYMELATCLLQLEQRERELVQLVNLIYSITNLIFWSCWCLLRCVCNYVNS